jgi:hypothetical protein
MNVILRFIRVNAFYFVFGLLQVICLYQVARFNSYQQTFYFNTSRSATGHFLSARGNRSSITSTCATITNN